jgi:hypothetical protein
MTLTRLCSFLVVAALTTFFSAVPIQRTDSVEVILIAEIHTIRQLDPLLVKVCADNNTRRPVVRAVLFGDEYGSVTFEMRRAGAGDYQRIRTVYTGISSPIVRGKGRLTQADIPPGDRYVSYEMLPGGGYPGISSNPGTFELRAIVNLGGNRIASAPVEIQVLPITDEDRKVLAEIAGVRPRGAAAAKGRTNWLEILVATSVVDDPGGIDRFRLLQQKLNDGYLKRTVGRLLATHALCAARTPAEKNEALGAFMKLYDQMDPLTAEVTDLILARAYISSGDYPSAEFHMNRIKDRSSLRDWVQTMLEHRLIQEAYP